MVLSESDRILLDAVSGGLPLAPRPYAVLGERIGMDEGEVITRLQALLAAGVIKRLGVVVRHRALGYRANAMVVWDVPDERVADIGERMARLRYVTLCYRRPRRPPVWPYNLFCMIHGQDRDTVLAQIDDAVARLGLSDIPRDVLFSRRCFKQRGACYAAAPRSAPAETAVLAGAAD